MSAHPWLTSSTETLETLTGRPASMGSAGWATWRPSEAYTVGIEEEVMLLDPDGWGLTQRGDEVLALAGPELAGRCAAETHEAALELRTAPHATVPRGDRRAARAAVPARWRSGAARHGGRVVRGASRTDDRADEGVPLESLPGHLPDHARSRPSRADVRPARPRWCARPAARDPVGQPTARAPTAATRRCRPPRRCCAGARPAWPRTVRSCSRASRAPGSRAGSTATGTGSRPSICCCVRARSPSRRSCGGTCARSHGWERSRSGSWTPSPGSRRRRR